MTKQIEELTDQVNATRKAYFELPLPTRTGSYGIAILTELCRLERKLKEMKKTMTNQIKFITPDYKELFKISDLESVSIAYPNNENSVFVCRYIDDTHFYLGETVYHICQFAELIGKLGAKVTMVISIKMVKKIAMDNYKNGGDGVIECWSDKDIQDWIDGTGDYADFGKGTIKGLLEDFGNFDEYRKEIQATAF